MPNPYVILVALLAIAGSFFYGMRVGNDRAVAQQARVEQLIEKVSEAAQRGAAKEIANIKIVNQTQRQVIERETRVVPDYSQCRNSPDGLRAINAALENRAGSTGSGVVPDADSAGR